MPFAFHYAARSDVGMVRSNNEDSAYAGPHLLALADGMGGHAGGDVASSTVIAGLVALDGEALERPRPQRGAARPRPRRPTPSIGNEVRPSRDLDGMGTTLIAMLRAGDKIVLAHIGDSRAFLVRDGVVTQVTKDHSFVQTLVDEGRITADEAQTHPQRSLVTRVLTGAVEDEPDLVVREGRIGDRYLLCLRRAHRLRRARHDRRGARRRRATPRQCADRLVALALRAGAPDNVTVVVSDIVDGTTGTAPPTQPRGRRRPRPCARRARGRCRRRPPRRPPRSPRRRRARHPTAARTTPTGDGVTLAEEGPRSRGGTVDAACSPCSSSRWSCSPVRSYAAYAWSQQQYHLSAQRRRSSRCSGASNQTLGPIALSRAAVRDDDRRRRPAGVLPEQPRAGHRRRRPGRRADARVDELRLQATACRWARSRGEECRTVPSTWTPPHARPRRRARPPRPRRRPAHARARRP